MKRSTPELQARHALGRALAGDYIEWAVDQLVAGYDSPNLRILAGLERFVSPFEAEEHFKRSRRELGLPEPNRDQAVKAYSIHLAEAILEQESAFESLVAELPSQLAVV